MTADVTPVEIHENTGGITGCDYIMTDTDGSIYTFSSSVFPRLLQMYPIPGADVEVDHPDNDDYPFWITIMYEYYFHVYMQTILRNTVYRDVGITLGGVEIQRNYGVGSFTVAEGIV